MGKASPGDIRAGRAFVEIFADDEELQRALDRVAFRLKSWGQQLERVGRGIVTFGTGSVAAILGAAGAFAKMGGDMLNMSQRTGISVEALSRLKYAAEAGGTGLDTLERRLQRMTINITDAGNGVEGAVKKLGELGLKFEDLKDLTPDKQFELIASRIAAIEDPTQKAAIAMDVLGRAAPALLIMMTQMDKFQKHAEDLGLVMSEQDAKAAAAFGDTIGDLWKQMKMLTFIIGGSVAPALGQFALKAGAAIKAIKEFIDGHRQLVVIAGTAAVAITALGGTFLGLGIALRLAAPVLTLVARSLGLVSLAAKGAAGGLSLLVAGLKLAPGILAVGFSGLYTAIKAVGTATVFLINPMNTVRLIASGLTGTVTLLGTGFNMLSAAMAATWSVMATGAGLLLSPMFLVGAAVIALAGYFLYTSGIAGRAWEAIKSAAGSTGSFLMAQFRRIGAVFADLWSHVKADAIEAFGGIRDSLAALDWALAGRIVWTILRLEWARGVRGLWDPFVSAFYRVRAFLENGWVTTVSAVKIAWSLAKEYLSNWDGIKTGALKIFNWLKNAWSSLIDYLADKFAGWIISIQAKRDILARFAGRTLNEGDARQLAGQAVENERNRLRQEQPSLKDEAFAAELNRRTAGILEQYRRKYAGRQLSESELDDLIQQETQFRRDQLNADRRKRDQANDKAYQEEINRLDAQFASKHPDLARAGEAERAKIRAQTEERRNAIAQELGQALSSLDAGSQARIDALKKALDDLVAQAKQEKESAQDQEEQKKKRQQKDIAAGLAAASTTTTTFNPNALFGVAANPVAQKIAQNTRDTADRLEKLLKKTTGGLYFS